MAPNAISFLTYTKTNRKIETSNISFPSSLLDQVTTFWLCSSFRDLLVLLVKFDSNENWLYIVACSHTHTHTHTCYKWRKVFIKYYHEWRTVNKFTLFVFRLWLRKCKQIYFANEERKPLKLLVPTEVVEMVHLWGSLIVQWAAFLPLSFWKGHKPAWLGGQKLLAQDSDTRSFPLAYFPKIPKLHLRWLFYKNPVWGSKAVGKSMSPEDLRRLLIKGHKKGGRDSWEWCGQLAPSLQVWNCNAPPLGGSATIPCPWMFLISPGRNVFVPFPAFRNLSNQAWVCKSSGFFWSSSWNHSS